MRPGHRSHAPRPGRTPRVLCWRRAPSPPGSVRSRSAQTATLDSHREIHLTSILFSLNLDTDKGGHVPDNHVVEASSLESGHQSVAQSDQGFRFLGCREVVEVTCRPVDESADDQGPSTRKSEPGRLRKVLDDFSDSDLQGRQQETLIPRWSSSQSAHARRTCRGITSSSHRSINSSTSMNLRTSSSVPSRRTCS